MVRRLRAGLVLVLFVALGSWPPARAQEMQYDQSGLIRRLLPMVVNVTAVVPLAVPVPHAASAMGDPGMQATEQKRQLGSGFIIDPSGVIVTNYHVIDGAYEIIVTFADSTQTQAEVLEADRLSDVALLKVTTPMPLPAVRWADSSTVKIGDPVLAIGNPLGVGMSVTGGIVSAVNRDIMETPYDNYIQTDAPINHGNSGGPLFDTFGKVVGINTAIISPTAGSAGLGFAIPANDARFVIGQLQRYGWIHPGWMGIKVQQLTSDMAEALGMAELRGSIVANVTKGGPAAKAGIEVGDVVVAYAGKTPPNERALLRDMASTPPGETVAISIRRGGRVMDLQATIAEWPRTSWEDVDAPIKPAKLTHAVPADLGIKVAALPEAQRIKLGLGPDTEGVLVTGVAPGTDAAQRGIAQGDAILRVQSHVLASTADFHAALTEARRQDRKFVLILRLPQKQVHPGPEWAALQIAP
jgi:serine protease Do